MMRRGSIKSAQSNLAVSSRSPEIQKPESEGVRETRYRKTDTETSSSRRLSIDSRDWEQMSDSATITPAPATASSRDSSLGVSHKGIFNGNQVRLYISPTTRIRVFRLSTQTEQHNNVREDRFDLYDVLVGANSPIDNIVKYVKVKPISNQASNHERELNFKDLTISQQHVETKATRKRKSSKAGEG